MTAEPTEARLRPEDTRGYNRVAIAVAVVLTVAILGLVAFYSFLVWALPAD